jgi:hypothetical protein
LASPVAWSPGGFAGFLQPLAQFQEPSGILRELLEAGGAHGADTVVESADRAALRQSDPPVVKHAVFTRDGIPATVFGAEVFGQVGYVEELLGEFERVVVSAHDDVGAGATLATIAAFGRMSSQLSVSRRTLTPVCSTNLLVFAAKLSNSDWTNCFQRSTLI